ncbi:hypothetical protein FRC06_008818, partial [Ceratobasidium sp. 370]
MPRCLSLLERALRWPRKIVNEGPYVRNSTHRSKRLPCFYCPHKSRSESGRSRHILQTESCRQAEEHEFNLGGLSAVAGDDRRMLWVREPTPNPVTRDQPPHVTPAEPSLERWAHSPSPPPLATPEPLPPLLPPQRGSATLIFDARRQLFVKPFPDPRAGAPINNRVAEALDLGAYMASMGNLGNPDDFETAELLMTTGLTNAGRDAHLKSRLYRRRTPWKNNKKLIADIDKLPHGPAWEAFRINLGEPAQGGHNSYLFTRNIVDTIRDLLANSNFKNHMRYTPEQLFTAEDGECRVYGEANSGRWWWRMQHRLPDKSGTIVPLIIASDRTMLSVMSGGQQAYPVYISLENIDKEVRRKPGMQATVLLAYLPVDKFQHVTDPTLRSRLRNELTHRAMEKVMEPLKAASKEGVEALCADGRYRKAYPMVAASTLDFQEQCLMACITSSGCPKCKQSYRGRGDYGDPAPPRTNIETLSAIYAYLEHGDRTRVDELGLQPVWPWWAHLPYTDFAASVTPDILHVLHQGLVKSHLVRWAYKASSKAQVDRYISAMPRAEGMRHFGQGISKLSQWTGRESKEIEKQLLPVIASLDGDKYWDQDFVRLARSILDFTYRIQASRMTEDDVVRLELNLREMHQLKEVLLRMKIFKNRRRFDKIAKLHLAGHWPDDIREMGTPDGYTTEPPEHLHIDSKVAFRASNKVRPMPQMIKFIQRFEALRIHRARMNAYLGRVPSEDTKRRKSRVIYEEDEVGASWEAPAGHVDMAHTGGNGGNVSNVGNRGMGGVGAGEGKDDEDEEDEEDEDEEQVHFAGRMKTTADARRHVVYPDPTLSIALKPTAGRVRGLDLVAKYGTTDLVHALHHYLKRHATRQNLPTNFLPTAYHEYPVWHRLYLRHRALPFDPEWPRRDVIRARPEDEEREGVFDVVLFLERRHEFGLQ